MATELKVPPVGESISEVEIGEWLKRPGEHVEKDEPLVTIESEKATVEVPAPTAGTLVDVRKQKGESAAIGEVIAYVEEAPASTPSAAAQRPLTSTAAEKTKPAQRVMPAAQRALAEHQLKPENVTPSGPGARVLKEDVLREAAARQPSQPPPPAPQAVSQRANERPPIQAPPTPTSPARQDGARQEEAVPMSRLRRTIAERLVQAQQNAALLTTFNEVDLSAVISLRKEHGEAFQTKYGAKLGFMSFFVKASVEALKAIPQVNAEIRGSDIVYHNYFDIGVAIGSGKGLVVPVLRNAERMSFAEIEIAIADFAQRAKENKLKLDELQGGTFTISNGGVYGSLLSTPIINPPQSGILGMHAIQERPVALQGNVVIRPMMYLALTYDHRIVDGREAVTFLRRIKEVIENPARMLLEI